MKKYIYKFASLGFIISSFSLFALAVPAYAVSLNSSANINASVGLPNVSAGAQGSVNAGASPSYPQPPVPSGNQNPNMMMVAPEMNASAGFQPKPVNMPDNSVPRQSPDSQAAASSQLDLSAPITVFRSDVDAHTDGQSSGPVIQPSQVATHDDIAAYVRASVAANPNIDSIESRNDGVSVSYRQSAKLLGFIPVSVDAKTTVAADGTVSVHYPWYRFLIALGKNVISSSDVKTQVQATVGNSATASGSAGFTASEQAQVLNAIQTYIKSHFDVSAESSASASAATN